MKNIDESRARLHGIFNITVTPFGADGSIDLAGIARSIERVLGLGYDGVLIGGTYGEFPVMSPDERAGLFRHVMDVVGTRAPVMLCSADSDPRVTRDLSILAGELGGVPMVMAPYVSEITDAQILAFFREIAPLSRTGTIIYNAPGIGITLSPALIEQLAEVEGIVALKQGDLSVGAIDRIANTLSGRIRLFCASDLAFHGPMMNGFDGISTTNSCALPELVLASFRAIQEGRAHESRDLHRLWYSYRALARGMGQPQTVKAAMALRGFDGGSVRRPLLDLDAGQKAAVAEVMRTIAADPRAGFTLA